MTTNVAQIFIWMERLQAANIHFALTTVRENAIMLQVSVPGERWEIEFFPDGAVEIERFLSTGRIESMDALHELMERHADK